MKMNGFLLGEKFIEESDNIKVLTFPKIKLAGLKDWILILLVEKKLSINYSLISIYHYKIQLLLV